VDHFRKIGVNDEFRIGGRALEVQGYVIPYTVGLIEWITREFAPNFEPVEAREGDRRKETGDRMVRSPHQLGHVIWWILRL
jgi:hypothetical protein